MGGSSSSELGGIAIGKIRRTTRFSSREIREMYEKFSADFPDGVITLEGFVRMYAGLYPSGDARRFAKHVFRAYDIDGNGEIDFHEFMATLSVASKGSVEEKLKWAYHIYDLNGDGEVSRPEAIEIISAVYRMHGQENARDLAEKQAIELFILMDKNKDDFLSEAEFVCAGKHSPVIRELVQGAS